MSKLTKAIPDYAIDLFTHGLISANTAAEGPSVAWTEWDKESRKFEVYIREDALAKCSQEVIDALMEHELNHIAGNHFKIECQGMDSLVAADVEANWWLKDKMGLLEEGLKIIDPDAHPVIPEEILGQLGLRTDQCYRAEIIHDMIHKECPDCGGGGEGPGGSGHTHGQNGTCGGIEKVDDSRANAIGGLTNAYSAEAQGRESWGKLYGSGAGGSKFKYRATKVPDWAKIMMEWARAIVEPCLDEGRKHSRPVWSMREAGIHVPSTKPQWGYAPKKAVVGLDTSGSMFGKVLDYTAAAVNYLRQHNISVQLVAGDVKAELDIELKNGFPKDLPGGGGTDITPTYDYIIETHKPDAVIFITDGYVPSWPKDKGTDTLWITLPDARPPFGKVAVYRDD